MKRLSAKTYPAAIAGILITFFSINWGMRFLDAVTLPNGLVLQRAFDGSRFGRWDLYTPDREQQLARDVEFLCFNDLYVYAQAKAPGFSGLFDADTRGRQALDYGAAMALSGLDKPGGGCNGYYTGWIGPGLLREGGKAPFLPSCALRNVQNTALRHPAWLARPCLP